MRAPLLRAGTGLPSAPCPLSSRSSCYISRLEWLYSFHCCLILHLKRLQSIMSACPITFAVQNAAVAAKNLDPFAALRAAADAGDAAAVLRRLAAGDNPGADDSAALRLAAAKGHVEVVKILLADSRVNAGAMRSAALRWACAAGVKSTVAILLLDPRVNPADDAANGGALGYAAQAGHLDVVDILLEDERVKPGAGYNAALRAASARGHASVVARLLSLPASAGIDPRACDCAALRDAAANGHTAAVAALLEDGRCLDDVQLGRSLADAAAAGHAQVVTALMTHEAAAAALSPASVHAALTNAADGGYTGIATALLAHPHCCEKVHAVAGAADAKAKELAASVATADALCEKCDALTALVDGEQAADEGVPDTLRSVRRALSLANEAATRLIAEHSQVVMELEQQIRPLCDAVQKAASKGHGETLAALLEALPRSLTDVLSPTAPFEAYPGSALVEAAAQGHIGTVQLLLADGRFPGNRGNSAALELAVRKLHIRVVDALLADENPLRADPSDVHSAALFACIAGVKDAAAHIAAEARTAARAAAMTDVVSRAVYILDALLRDGRANPGERGSSVLVAAACGGGEAAPLVARLLEDPRLNVGARGMEAVAAAASYPGPAMLRLLLACPRLEVRSSSPSLAVGSAWPAEAAVDEPAAAPRLVVVPAPPDVDPLWMSPGPILLPVFGGAYRWLTPSAAYVLRTAVSNDAADCVTVLLQDGRFDPAGIDEDDREAPLKIAASSGFASVIAALLADPRTRGDADESAALQSAVINSQLEAVDQLLSDEGPYRADPAARGCAAVLEALSSGYVRMIDRLLSDRRSVAGLATLGAAARKPAAEALPYVLNIAWRRRRAVVLSRAVALESDE